MSTHPAVSRAIGALAGDARIRVRQASGQFCPAQVTTELGVDEHHWQLGSDGRWRLGIVSTYGNESFVHGDGCEKQAFHGSSPFHSRTSGGESLCTAGRFPHGSDLPQAWKGETPVGRLP